MSRALPSRLSLLVQVLVIQTLSISQHVDVLAERVDRILAGDNPNTAACSSLCTPSISATLFPAAAPTQGAVDEGGQELVWLSCLVDGDQELRAEVVALADQLSVETRKPPLGVTHRWPDDQDGPLKLTFTLTQSAADSPDGEWCVALDTDEFQPFPQAPQRLSRSIRRACESAESSFTHADFEILQQQVGSPLTSTARCEGSLQSLIRWSGDEVVGEDVVRSVTWTQPPTPAVDRALRAFIGETFPRLEFTRALNNRWIGGRGAVTFAFSADAILFSDTADCYIVSKDVSLGTSTIAGTPSEDMVPRVLLQWVACTEDVSLRGMMLHSIGRAKRETQIAAPPTIDRCSPPARPRSPARRP